MTINVGSADRALRIVLGVILVILPLVTTLSIWANPVALFGVPVIGFVLVVTGIIRFCPLYRVVGFRSTKA